MSGYFIGVVYIILMIVFGSLADNKIKEYKEDKGLIVVFGIVVYLGLTILFLVLAFNERGMLDRFF